MLKEQKFGVEIEMTGITREAAAKMVAKILDSISSNAKGHPYYTRTIKDSIGREWKIMRDSSIIEEVKNGYASDEHKVEFVTPPLNYADIELLQGIIRELRKAGAITNSSCGIHIHVDGVNHTPKSLKKLVMFMISRQDLIYEALEIGARGTRWCRKLNAKILEELKSNKELTRDIVERIWYSTANDNYCGGVDHEHYNQTRYHGVNLHSYFSKGTVEFRLFNSTLHAGKIKAYIQFCLSMEGYTPKQKVTIMRNILTLRLGLSGNEFKTCRLHLMTPVKKAADMNVAA